MSGLSRIFIIITINAAYQLKQVDGLTRRRKTLEKEQQRGSLEHETGTAKAKNTNNIRPWQARIGGLHVCDTCYNIFERGQCFDNEGFESCLCSCLQILQDWLWLLGPRGDRKSHCIGKVGMVRVRPTLAVGRP